MFIQNDDCAIYQVGFELSQDRDDTIRKRCRRNILSSHLQHARPARPGVGEDRAKIQIVGEYDVPMVARPVHDLVIDRLRITDPRPMNCLKTAS